MKFPAIFRSGQTSLIFLQKKNTRFPKESFILKAQNNSCSKFSHDCPGVSVILAVFPSRLRFALNSQNHVTSELSVSHPVLSDRFFPFQFSSSNQNLSSLFVRILTSLYNQDHFNPQPQIFDRFCSSE